MAATPRDEHVSRYMHTAFMLFERAPKRSALRSLAREVGAWSYDAPAPGPFGWVTHGPTLTTTTADGIRVVVDIVDRPYPDHADREDPASPALAGFALGEFGDHTLPGALARAATQGDLLGDPWSAISRHKAFVRIRTSKLGPDGRAFGEDAPRSILVRSMALVTHLGAKFASAPGAIAWFAPGGEVIASTATLQVLDGRDDWTQRPPVEVWVGVRRLGHPASSVLEVETVGAAQLGLEDLAFRTELSPATWLTARVDAYDLVFESLESVPVASGNVVPMRPRTPRNRVTSSAG